MTQSKYLVIYDRGGTGRGTLHTNDFTIMPSGHLSFVDRAGNGHVFSASERWHIRETSDDAAATEVPGLAP